MIQTSFEIRRLYSPDDLELRPMLFLDFQCQNPHLDLHIDHRRLMGLVKKCRGTTGSSGFPVAYLGLTQGNLLNSIDNRTIKVY